MQQIIIFFFFIQYYPLTTRAIPGIFSTFRNVSLPNQYTRKLWYHSSIHRPALIKASGSQWLLWDASDSFPLLPTTLEQVLYPAHVVENSRSWSLAISFPSLRQYFSPTPCHLPGSIQACCEKSHTDSASSLHLANCKFISLHLEATPWKFYIARRAEG